MKASENVWLQLRPTFGAVFFRGRIEENSHRARSFVFSFFLYTVRSFGMGSLGSCDGMGLFLSRIMDSRGSKSVGKIRKTGNSVGAWSAILATSKCGLGLYASGAPLNIQEFLSPNLDLYTSTDSSQGRRGQGFFSEQLWTRWLRRQGNRGGLGSPFNWNLGTAKTGPWRLFPSSPGAPPDSSRGGKISARGLGGGSEARPSNSSDNNGLPSGTLTSLILGLNVLVFLGQIASKGRLLLYGAKINALIERGQWWRLLTPSVLHANIFHLLINSYSLKSIGPTVENLAGPRRFLAVYSASAVTSTTLSYFCCASPSVGASGAIFGVVGALAVFLIRHKNMMVNGEQSLKQVARVIAINLVLGVVSDGIDNWGHLGGLLGGAAVTWLLGPVYTFEVPPDGGQKQLVDRPPISHLFPSRFRR